MYPCYDDPSDLSNSPCSPRRKDAEQSTVAQPKQLPWDFDDVAEP